MIKAAPIGAAKLLINFEIIKPIKIIGRLVIDALMKNSKKLILALSNCGKPSCISNHALIKIKLIISMLDKIISKKTMKNLAMHSRMGEIAKLLINNQPLSLCSI